MRAWNSELATSLEVRFEFIKAESKSLLCSAYACHICRAYRNERVVVVAKGIQLSTAEIQECVVISINNVVALALLEVNEVEDLWRLRLIALR